MKQYVKFFPNQLPPMASGRYTVKVSQETNVPNCSIKDTVFNFVVATEQIALNPDIVYSTFPPRQSAANYQNCLPHIVLKRNSLPWERLLFENDKQTPWLYLFVFSQDEGVTASTDKYVNAINSQNIFVPALGNRYGSNDEMCTYIDIPYSLFSDALPKKEELKYLAHVKLVSLDDKVTDKDVNNGWFSCVVANRYPKKPENACECIKHEAHLVSLEGFQAFLKKREQGQVGGKDTVRMFSLANWEFFSQYDNLDFAGNAKKLTVTRFAPETGSETPNTALKNIIRLGYSAVNHHMREGTKTVSWYRPPMIPHPPNKENGRNCNYSDSLLRYDPEFGMFDLTYQAAWQLGRMLAFADKKFTKHLISWRLNTKQTLCAQQTQQALASTLGGNSLDSASVNEMLKAKMEIAARQAIEECGKDDFVNLKNSGLPDFQAMAERLDRKNDARFTQQDLLNLFDEGEDHVK